MRWMMHHGVLIKCPSILRPGLNARYHSQFQVLDVLARAAWGLLLQIGTRRAPPVFVSTIRHDVSSLNALYIPVFVCHENIGGRYYIKSYKSNF